MFDGCGVLTAVTIIDVCKLVLGQIHFGPFNYLFVCLLPSPQMTVGILVHVHLAMMWLGTIRPLATVLTAELTRSWKNCTHANW